MGLEVRLFGDLAVELDGETLEVGGQRQRCLLAVLLLNRGRTVSRADLAAWAWPAETPDSVNRQIANYVSRLRTVLGPAGEQIRLLARAPGFAAVLEPELIDVECFLTLLDQAREARSGQESQIAADRLHRALALWRGRPLEGLDTPYLRRRAETLDQHRRDAVLLLAELDLEAKRPGRAVAALRELASQRPDDEAVVATLVQALTGAGQPAEAAKLAQRTERLLIKTGRTPTPALRQAHTDALAGRAPTAPAKPGGARHQLPADTGAFTGREDELFEIFRLAKRSQSTNSPGAPMIGTIDGMGGIGKTALAVHAAHLLAEQFPDGQLFLELHTHSTTGPARTAFDALGTALATLGAPAHAVPDELDARAAGYRAALAGTRTLIVLDDVADEAQVRPLLPGADGCLVLITSRRRLKGLDDTESVSLEVLPPADAVALFRTAAGPDRVPVGDDLIEQVAERCGRLPLALRITAALLRHRRSWGLEHLLHDLHTDGAGLEVFHDGHRSLAAAFELSYRHLTPEQQTLFRCLGQVPGPDADAYAAAALTGSDPRSARRVLHDLVDRSLLAEPVAGRFRLHDLLREYARALAERDDAPSDRDAALGRLFDFYQHTAQLADRHIRATPAVQVPATPRPPRHHPRLADREAADAWLAAEIDNLMAAAHRAAERPDPVHAVTLPATISGHLRNHGPWAQALALHAAAADIADGLNDPLARAAALTELGRVRRQVGNHAGAAEALTQASELYQRLHDVAGQARTMAELGLVRGMLGDFPGAVDAVTQAAELYRRLDRPAGRADALITLSGMRRQTGDYPGAVDAAAQAMELYRSLDQPLGQANALISLGIVGRLTRDFPGAAAALAEALDLYERLDQPLGQGAALIELSRVRRHSGDVAGSLDAGSQAAALLQRLGTPSGQSIALACVGAARRLGGDHDAALAALEQALRISRDIGERGNEAWTLNHYAAALDAAGRTAEALTAYRQALRMNRELKKPDDEAAALEGLGEILLRTGPVGEGIDHLRQALEVFERLGMRPDAERVRGLLAGAA